MWYRLLWPFQTHTYGGCRSQNTISMPSYVYAPVVPHSFSRQMNAGLAPIRIRCKNSHARRNQLSGLFVRSDNVRTCLPSRLRLNWATVAERLVPSRWPRVTPLPVCLRQPAGRSWPRWQCRYGSLGGCRPARQHGSLLRSASVAASPVPPPMPATTPARSMTKTTIKLVQSGEHHVLAFSHGDATLVSKKTMITVGNQDLMFTAGATRVHLHGRSFEASATEITTLADNTIVLDGDVHFNCDDHGKSMFYKGSKAVIAVHGDEVNLVVEKH